MPLPAGTRLTQGTALFLSSFSAGISLTLSTFLVPRLLESPTDVMLSQWARTYALGAATMPLTAAVTAAAYLWLGLRGGVGAARSTARWYLAAGALTFGIVPYTALTMSGTNARLKDMEKRANQAGPREVPSKEAAAEQERSAKGLVDWWGVLNLGRSAMLVAAAACGLVATL